MGSLHSPFPQSSFGITPNGSDPITACPVAPSLRRLRSGTLLIEPDRERLRGRFVQELQEAFRENGEIDTLDIKAFFPSSRARYIVVLGLRFYLDDSGDSTRGPLCVMAGLVSTAKKWKTFEEAWGTILHKAGLDIFHANKFFNKKGAPYQDWSETQHRSFTQQFSKIAGGARYILTGVGRGVEVAPYTDLVLEDRSVRQFFTSHGRPWPTLLCTHLCLEALAKSLNDFDPSQKEKVVVILEQGPDVQRIIDHCVWLKEHVSWASRYEHFCPGTKKCRPLQAADLFAYETRRYISEQHLRQKGDPVRPSFQKISQQLGISIGLATKQNIIKIVDLIKRSPVSQ
jgi:uncharacterized protein DUF3800